MPKDLELDGQGETEELESTETLVAVKKKLSEMADPKSPMLTFTKQELGLLKSMIATPEKDDDYRQALKILDFLSDEEADDFVAAIWEDKRYGMDIGPDLDWALARCSVNRPKTAKNNLMAMIMDTMSHQKFTSYGQKRKDKIGDGRSSIIEN